MDRFAEFLRYCFYHMGDQTAHHSTCLGLKCVGECHSAFPPPLGIASARSAIPLMPVAS